MKKLFFCLCALVLLAGHAQAQQTAPQYCNAAAMYDTAVLGNMKVVSAPAIGGIYVCGFILSSAATTTIGARLTYSTSGVVSTPTTGGNLLVSGAAFNGLTPVWQFNTNTVISDPSPAYKGIFVPNGNQLNVSTSLATGPIQAIIYYWTQNP